jgi:hypothetical protein
VYISADPARGFEFEQFVLEILERSSDIELTAAPSSYGRDYGFDLTAARNGMPLLIQVKLTTPQMSYRLEQINAVLNSASEGPGRVPARTSRQAPSPPRPRRSGSVRSTGAGPGSETHLPPAAYRRVR